MDIIKVQYKGKGGEYSGREYSYFSSIPLQVGDELMVPVRSGLGAAKVSATGVPEAEVAAFIDKVKTIDKLIPVENIGDLFAQGLEAGLSSTDDSVAAHASKLAASVSLDPLDD